jgi:hypothetical protein
VGEEKSEYWKKTNSFCVLTFTQIIPNWDNNLAPMNKLFSFVLLNLFDIHPNLAESQSHLLSSTGK